MNDGLGVFIGAWLQPCVAYVGLAGEVELLCEVEAGLMGCVADVHWEGDFAHAGFRDVGKTPRNPYQSGGWLEEREGKKEGMGELHFGCFAEEMIKK